MTIPRVLKIGGHTIAVTLVALPEDIMAESDITTNEIRINSTIAHTQQEAALFHEILHFLNWTFDDQPLGHALLESLSEQLYQVFAENRLLSP